MHPHSKDSTINYPAADSWQPLILLTSALLLLLQRLTFKNSSAGFSRVLKSPDYYSIRVCFIISMCLLSPPSQLWGQISRKMLDLLSRFMKTKKKKKEWIANQYVVHFRQWPDCKLPESLTEFYSSGKKTMTICLSRKKLYVMHLCCNNVIWFFQATFISARSKMHPDALACCREQGRHRGHLYSLQNCAVQDNYFHSLNQHRRC